MKMNYKLIIESGEWALILRGSRMKEYAVVNGLDKEKAYGLGRVFIIILTYIRHYHKPKH